jgi:dienelactone hydrolase
MVGWPDLARALRLGAILGAIFGAVNIAFSWLFPLSDDTVGALLRFYGPMFGAWAFAAFRATRRDGRISTGIVTAVAVAFSTFVVFALMNLVRVNLFLDDITGRADWQRMMAIFRASGFDSLRAFVAVEFIKDLPLKVAVAATIGAIMGVLGGAVGRVRHDRISRVGIGVLLLLIAGTLVNAQTARFAITPESALIDERLQVVLDGLKPGQDVTIRVDGNNGQWQSSGQFRSDDRGRVEIADPMKLIWSATGSRVPAGTARGVQPWTFTAEVDGRAIATQTITRRAAAENVRIEPVRERGLVGMVLYPAGPGPHPAMIVLPGSQGGVPGPGGPSGGLASRGYVVLGLAYFNAEGLPPLLQNIPLEYFATAVEWLKAQASVDSSRIGVMGTSRGGELALLLGATYPSLFRVVVANVPSNVVWPGLSDGSEIPAWTLNGKPVIGVPGHFTSADLMLSGRERFLKRLHDKDAVARAEIAVERIGGPVLLLSGKDDQLWPSDVFSARVVERLKAHHFKHPVEHYTYDDAGHMMARPFVPTSDVRQVRIHPISKRPNMSGGTPEGQARANEDAWGKLLRFLDTHLRNRQ